MKLLGSEFCSQLPQVTTEILFTKTGEPHPDGLFSEIIFGKSPKERSEKFASIHLNTELFHSEVWHLLRRIFRDEVKAILQGKKFVITNTGRIEILDEGDNREDYLLGVHSLVDRFLEIEIPDTIAGKQLKAIVDKYPDYYKISCVPVIPPIYRQVIDEFSIDPLNSAYINLIKYSKLLIGKTKSYKDETYAKICNLMQLQIQTIYEVLTSKLGKKAGAIRSLLLGKRLDFTARSVIVVDPEIEVDQLGVPVRVAVKLFEAWLIRELTLHHKLSIDEALDVIQKISSGFVDKNHELYQIVKSSLEIVTKDRVVLAKRDPSLHRLSWQAFRIKLVDDYAIHVCPLVTVPFNADFDGDSIDGCVKIFFGKNMKELDLDISKLENMEVEIDETGNIVSFLLEVD